MTDEEYLKRLSKIEVYAEILLGILRMVPIKNIFPVEIYSVELIKKLKFEKLHYPDLLRACIDLLDDSQLAINEFYKNGLIAKSGTTGEMYLRLYGIVNACYLQMNSVIDLLRIFNIPDQTTHKSNLKNLKLIEVRNKLGSHTTNYINTNNNETDFFKLVKTSLDKWGEDLVIVSNKEKVEKINLLSIMKEFTFEIEKTLDIICEKSIHSIFKDAGHSKKWLMFRLEFTRKQYS